MTDCEPRTPVISYAPTLLVALALCTFVLSHSMGYGVGAKSDSESLKRLNSLADVQITLLKDHRGMVEHSIEQLRPRVDQAEAIQKTFLNMVTEVRALARSGDEDARRIIGN